MFWAILWALLAFVSTFVLWPMIFGGTMLASAGAFNVKASAGCMGLLIALVLNGLWLAWIALCIVKSLAGFGVDIPVF